MPSVCAPCGNGASAGWLGHARIFSQPGNQDLKRVFRACIAILQIIYRSFTAFLLFTTCNRLCSCSPTTMADPLTPE
jgi:hypothetical protein